LISKITVGLRQRALGLGLEVLNLDASYDVDDAHSLQRLVYELALDQTANPALPCPAPVTHAFLEQNALADRRATGGVTMTRPRASGSRPHSTRNLNAAKSSC
jgi:hypothetical protein